jgi:hypothetical protein
MKIKVRLIVCAEEGCEEQVQIVAASVASPPPSGR